MRGNYIIINIILIVLISTGNIIASLYVKSSRCDSNMGKIVEVVNDEIFTIAVCNDIKVFKEFSYCYGVAEGDEVVFDWFTHNCRFVGFTVLRNGVRCGVLCP